MRQIEDFSDERHKAWCVHCGGILATSEVNRDHAPSKTLLRRPLPAYVPQVVVCRRCNGGFSKDEEYFTAFLSCVLAGSTEPSAQRYPAIGRALARNPALRARLEAARRGGEHEATMWEPEMDRVRRVVAKNARGHAAYELGEPMMNEPASVTVMPLASLHPETRAAFEDASWQVCPEVGSRMLTRILSGEDMLGAWVIVQDGVYRYAVFQEENITVRTVIWDYLATETRWS